MGVQNRALKLFFVYPSIAVIPVIIMDMFLLKSLYTKKRRQNALLTPSSLWHIRYVASKVYVTGAALRQICV